MTEGTMVMTEDLHTAAKVLLATMQGGLERKRQLWQLREEVAKYRRLLADSEAALAVEEAEAKDDGQLIRSMFETWREEVEAQVKTPAVASGEQQ